MKHPIDQAIAKLRKIAMSYPEVEEGSSCNKIAFRARNKAFLFVGSGDDAYNIMVKLDTQLSAAKRLEANDPDRFKVGAHGWTTAVFRFQDSVPNRLVEAWIAESFRLLAPKTLVASLSATAKPSSQKTSKKSTVRVAEKKTPKKKSTKKRSRPKS